MSKFRVSAKPPSAPISPATRREQFVEGAGMVQTQTAGRALKPIRVNFDLDLATHRRLKLRAMDRNLSVASLIRKLIEGELGS